MAERVNPRVAPRVAPRVYSIAAHRGFADALAAGLVPRYSDDAFGLARLTLLLPSTRAMRTMNEAFIRHYGDAGHAGMLMPRMVVIGDLDLNEALGPLLDPLGGHDIPRAVDPTRRWLRLADILRDELGRDNGKEAPPDAAIYRVARDIAATMDRLLVEDIGPERLLEDEVLNLAAELSGHWQDSLRVFARVQARWLAELTEIGAIDTAARRNRLFDHAADHWRHHPPSRPIVAAGITSAAPALARLLRTIAMLPDGSVVLPDFDLSVSDAVWDELGAAGATENPGGTPFARGDAVTHPQYHMKLLLNRMGVARGEVRQWHRRGAGASPPERTHAIANLFLPSEASKAWVDLPADQRRLSGVRIMESAGPEDEAQAVALTVRHALETPEKRIAVVTPDRGLARRIVQHLRRWNIIADDSAGQALSQTPAGRLVLLLAELQAEHVAPVPLLALLQHPMAKGTMERGVWLNHSRHFERALRGPRPAPGLDPLDTCAAKAGVERWWAEVRTIVEPLFETSDAGRGTVDLTTALDRIAVAGEALCGETLWSREDGRALSTFIDDLRSHARDTRTRVHIDDLYTILRDAMEEVAVRPSYGGHPRVAIYGLLESRMSRADLTICAGLNEGSWPATPATDPLLATAILRALGVPGSDFRIGLSAHDLAAALGAPVVVLSRSERDAAGPAIPSRFLLRVKALVGADLIGRHSDEAMPALARRIDHPTRQPAYERPEPCPTAKQRRQRISVTALDRLRSDPYQFYAASILRLRELDTLDAEPTAAWRGSVAHEILERWHGSDRSMSDVAQECLAQMDAHPLMRALWEPRLMKALEWVEGSLKDAPERMPERIEAWGEMDVRGIRIFGKADRIDRLPGGALAIVDYKTGDPPSGREVEAGYALQLGTIGLMAQHGGFDGLTGTPERFEYWSLAKSDTSATGFGYIATPIKEGSKKTGMMVEDFLPKAEHFLHDALDRWILGTEPFTARLNPDAAVYTTFDQLMRLDEWMGREA